MVMSLLLKLTMLDKVGEGDGFEGGTCLVSEYTGLGVTCLVSEYTGLGGTIGEGINGVGGGVGGGTNVIGVLFMTGAEIGPGLEC